jgi:hypothetical protein
LLEPSEFHYFILRIYDYYVRIGIQGDIEKAEAYFKSNYKYILNDTEAEPEVVFMITLPLPIASDVDKWCGLGCNTFEDFTIVSCKHIHQMRTIKNESDMDFYSRMKEAHILIKDYQRELLEEVSS